MDTSYRRRWTHTVTGLVLAALTFGWLTVSAAAAPPLDAVAAGARPGVAAAGRAQTLWAWPLDPVPRVVRPFDKPPGPYAAGHRGLDLAGSVGQRVLAVDDGVLWHAGPVAGRVSVTIDHGGGLRSTYEPLTLAAGVARGSRVSAGQVIGTLSSSASHCAPAACLHLGALRQGSAGEWDYVQPLFYLLDTRVVLLPSG